MVAETEIIYVFGWGGLGLVLGIIACSVYYNKGYTSEAIAGLIGGFLCFPLGLLAVIQALAAKDKLQEQQIANAHRAHEAQARRIWNLERKSKAVAAQFMQCPRCGAQNGIAQGACWQCQLPFPSGEPETVAPPPLAANVPVFAPAPPPLAEKIRCIKCRKKFSGEPAKLASLRSCPGCKASPFLTEPA